MAQKHLGPWLDNSLFHHTEDKNSMHSESRKEFKRLSAVNLAICRCYNFETVFESSWANY